MGEESKRKRQFKRQNEHTKETRDRFQACFNKGTLARIREKIGEKSSVNAYICRLVYEDLDGALQRSEDQEEPAKAAEIRQSGELNKARQALKQEKIRKEEEENRAKMDDQQRLAQAFIDQARQKEAEAAEEAEEAKRWEMWKPALNDDEK